MTKLAPFFVYYGGKNRAARTYPEPVHQQIVEPFAGSAGYACNYPDHDVLLIDKDPVIVETWRYLLAATPEDILALPDLGDGQTVDDLDVPTGARYLIGWWLNKGSAAPAKRPSTFMLRYPQGGPYWGERIRERVAGQLERVAHWRVALGSYESAPDVEATWFIDPPYIGGNAGGRHYRHGSRQLDYADLGAWCKGRQGQVVVCEADDADWLPFRPLAAMHGTEGRQKKARARMEVIWP